MPAKVWDMTGWSVSAILHYAASKLDFSHAKSFEEN